MTAGFGITGPLDFATPELWVLDDDRFEDAQRILSEMKTVEDSKKEDEPPSSGGNAETAPPQKWRSVWEDYE